jgi:hypothetical protein
MFVILAPPAHVTDPGGKIGYSDKFLAQPGEIGDMAEMHNTWRTFIAGYGLGHFIGVIYVHLTAFDSGSSPPKTSSVWLTSFHSGGGQ